MGKQPNKAVVQDYISNPDPMTNPTKASQPWKSTRVLQAKKHNKTNKTNNYKRSTRGKTGGRWRSRSRSRSGGGLRPQKQLGPPAWDMTRVNSDAPPPPLHFVDRGKLLLSASFTSPMYVTSSLASPYYTSKVPGVKTRRVTLFQPVVYQGWRYMVVGHLYVDVAQDADGVWTWTPQLDAHHGIYLSLFTNSGGSMTRGQNVGAWTTFLSLVTDHKDLSQQSGSADDSVVFLGDHPKNYATDLRIPVPAVNAPDQ